MVVVKFILPSRCKSKEFEVLRWSVSQAQEELTIANIKTKLCQFFRNPKASFFMTWNDGVDDCSLIDDQSIEELLEYAKTNGVENDIRVHVKLMESETVKQQNIQKLIQELEELEIPETELEENLPALDLTNQVHNVPYSPSHNFPKPDSAVDDDFVHTQLDSMDRDSIDSNPRRLSFNHVFANQNPAGQPAISYPMAAMLFSPQMNTWNPIPYCQPGPTSSNVSSLDQTSQRQPSDEISFENRSVTHTMDNCQIPTPPIQYAAKISHEHPRKAHSKSHDKHHNSKKSHKPKSEYCEYIIKQLRAMGYRQEEKKIKKLIEKYDGDISQIVDKLH